MKIRLAENFRAVFYAPFYACLALGWFRDRGLEVSLVDSPSPGAGIADMLKGEVHLVWGGPMRVLKDRDQSPPGPHSLLAFGEVAGRDPFYLVGRSDLKRFELPALTGLQVATVSEVVTPMVSTTMAAPHSSSCFMGRGRYCSVKAGAPGIGARSRVRQRKVYASGASRKNLIRTKRPSREESPTGGYRARVSHHGGRMGCD